MSNPILAGAPTSSSSARDDDEERRPALARRAARPALAMMLAAAGPGIGAAVLLGFAVAHAEWLAAGGPMVVLVLLALGVFACGLALLPTHALSLACGWALGGVAGAGLALLAAIGAALVTSTLARRWVGEDFVAALRHRYPRFAEAHAALTTASPRRTALLVALLRLSPAMPFAATNVLLTAAGVPRPAFLLGTAVGMFPRIAAVSVLGASLAGLDFSAPAAPWLAVAGVAATVLAIIVIGLVTRAAWQRMAGRVTSAAVPEVAGRPAVPAAAAVPAPTCERRV